MTAVLSECISNGFDGRIGVTGAQAGTLTFLVGGSESTFHNVEPILRLMGQRIIHCGPSGAGLAAKICNNLMLGIEQIAVAEAMLLGQKLGLHPAVLASVVNSSTGSCWSSSVNNPVKGSLPGKKPPCEREFEGGFATALMFKVGGYWSEGYKCVTDCDFAGHGTRYRKCRQISCSIDTW
jgi:3-hydroxyisobutyrate dehydrogenase-like beta-hydroxyacid dehydrogenase